MTDIAELHTAEAANDGAEMQVRGPDGKPRDCYIMLAGIDAPEWRTRQRTRQRAAIERAIAAASGADMQPAPTADDVDLDDLVAAVRSWRGFTTDGADYECTPDNVRALFTNAPYIRDQADAFIARRSNYIKKPPTG